MDFTINFDAINLLVVFAATVVANILGGLWYSPFLFGNIWRKALGKTGQPEPMTNPAGTFIAGFVLQLIAASLLAAMLGPGAGAAEGIQLGTLLAFAFVFTATALNNLFERRTLIIIFVNAGYHVVAMGCMGAIIGTWG
ncbi:MAG: DUF1761 domain-containing protein [Gammaproteobacteria bacterium]|nr:DUF1761 domain-containing protein [Gammaproteobacteria bacterium]NND55029.1 DUF1761 domain-containing protein [Gammaproteobacteria bacterium]